MTALHPGRPSAGPDPEAGPGRLVFDTSRSRWSPHLAHRHVRIRIDSLPIRVGWGRTPVDLPAGRHLVEVRVGRGHGWGPVVDAVPVAAGATVEVFYRAPALPHLAGALGPVPQSTPGLRAFALGAALLAIIVVAALVALLA